MNAYVEPPAQEISNPSESEVNEVIRKMRMSSMYGLPMTYGAKGKIRSTKRFEAKDAAPKRKNKQKISKLSRKRNR